MGTSALRVDSAKNWRSLYQTAGAFRPSELVTGAEFALVFGPINVAQNAALTSVQDRVYVPVACKLKSGHFQGFPTGEIDIDIRDATPATVLSAVLELTKPSTLGGEPAGADGEIVPAVSDAAYSAGDLLTVRVETGAGESVQDLTGVLIFIAT